MRYTVDPGHVDVLHDDFDDVHHRQGGLAAEEAPERRVHKHNFEAAACWHSIALEMISK